MSQCKHTKLIEQQLSDARLANTILRDRLRAVIEERNIYKIQLEAVRKQIDKYKYVIPSGIDLIVGVLPLLEILNQKDGRKINDYSQSK